ncbi:MAG: hypothetical protein IJ545_04900 [Alphaproteobacteria bacterium]|nr:hypothetical protein [Alphaproteobacteria bacterium]
MSYTTETTKEKIERIKKELLELYEELEELKQKPFSKYLTQRIEVKRSITWREKYLMEVNDEQACYFSRFC